MVLVRVLQRSLLSTESCACVLVRRTASSGALTRHQRISAARAPLFLSLPVEVNVEALAVSLLTGRRDGIRCVARAVYVIG